MGFVMYYQWQTQEDFDIWHNALCEQLGYPEIVNGITITDSYTKGFFYNNLFIAYVDENYADGLSPIEYVKTVAVE
jgi:hypothetical protein